MSIQWWSFDEEEGEASLETRETKSERNVKKDGKGITTKKKDKKEEEKSLRERFVEKD